MGSACSIETTEYNDEKFAQSKVIMSSEADDLDKFNQLKALWGLDNPPAPVEIETASAELAETSTTMLAASKSGKTLPPGNSEVHKQSAKDLQALVDPPSEHRKSVKDLPKVYPSSEHRNSVKELPKLEPAETPAVQPEAVTV